MRTGGLRNRPMRELILLHAEYDLDVESIEHRGSTYQQDVSDLTEILSVTARLVWMTHRSRIGGHHWVSSVFVASSTSPKIPKLFHSRNHTCMVLSRMFLFHFLLVCIAMSLIRIDLLLRDMRTSMCIDK